MPRKLPKAGVQRPWAWRVLSLLLVAGFAAWAVWFLRGRWEVWADLKRVPAGTLIRVGALAAGAMVCRGLTLRALVGHFGVSLRFSEWFGLTAIAGMLNYLLPFRGGAAVRAAYLRARQALALTQFGSIFAAAVAFQVLSRCLIAVACLGLLWAMGRGTSAPLAGACLVVAAVIAGAMRFAPRLPQPESRVLLVLWRLGEGWRTVHRDRKVVVQVLALNVLTGLAVAGMYSLALWGLGAQCSLLTAVAVSAVGEVGMTIAITPAGLGIYEAFATGSASLLGAAAPQALVAALVARSAFLALSLVLGPVFLIRLRPGRAGGPPWDGEADAPGSAAGTR